MEKFRYIGSDHATSSVFIEGFGFVQIPYISDEMAAISIKSGAKFFEPINDLNDDNTAESSSADSGAEETGGLRLRSTGETGAETDSATEKQPDAESTSEGLDSARPDSGENGSDTDTSVGNTGDSASAGNEDGGDTGAASGSSEDGGTETGNEDRTSDSSENGAAGSEDSIESGSFDSAQEPGAETGSSRRKRG